MTDKFDNMIMRLFVIRLGKAKNQEWRVVYGVVTPCIEKMDEPIVSESTSLCSCRYGTESKKISVRTIIYASERDIVLGVFEDLSSGLSLNESFKNRGLDADILNLDASFSQQKFEEPWGMENILDRQLTYTKSVSMIEPERLLEKDGMIPDNADESIRYIENYLKKSTKLPFGDKFDHVGNMDIIIEPDRDPNGKCLVELKWDKEAPACQHVVVSKEMLTDASDVIVNVRFADGGRVLGDRVKCKTADGKDLKFDFDADDGTSCIETKVWLCREGEFNLVHHAMVCLLKTISVTMNAVGGRMKVTSDWMKKIRENLPPKKEGELEAAKVIEYGSKERFVVGEKTKRKVKRKTLVKTNDEFFPKGWDSDTETQGMLSFLSWFKQKVNDAQGVFLQDPYFEDVAMFFIASADTNCEYTVLTQTQLRTNPDGTANTDLADIGDDGMRKKKIVDGIMAYPLLFEPMKLVIKDIPITHNVLHDRYMVFDYGNDHVEAYMLSNSLQGATSKQPLLVTQIGDLAFEKVRKHIDQTMECEGIETIYDYQSKVSEDEDTEDYEPCQIADRGFYNRLVKQKDALLSGDVADILLDMRTWNTNNKIATFGYFLAADMHDDEADRILSRAAEVIAEDSGWVSILKDFVLKVHYSKYPTGYIRCPYKGWVHADTTTLLGMDYKDIVNPYNVHLLDYMACEIHTFGVYGQYFAVKLLIKVAPYAAIDVLKQLRPTLLAIKTDKTITPVFKVTQMLMSELMETVVWNKDSEVMRLMLNDTESWCRGIGALMLLYKAKSDTFGGAEYRTYMKNDDELANLCYAAWGMKPEPANKEIFYQWLLDLITDKADIDFFKAQLEKVIVGTHMAEDKADFIAKVALPLVSVGMIDKDSLTEMLIEKLYDETISGQQTYSMRRSLIFCLKKTGGNISSLIEKAAKTLDKVEREMASILVKNDDNVFHAAEPTIQLRVLLLLFIREYSDCSMIDEVKKKLSEVDNSLDSHGLKETKRLFETL